MAKYQGKLTDEMKTFIVQCNAMFDAPSAVVKALKEEFGVDITRQFVQALDPTKRQGRDCAKKWKAIFDATRAEFLENTAGIAIAHRAVRLRYLQRMLDRVEGMQNYPLAAQLLEQAAKESGGAFTNRRELSGPDGKPIETDALVRIDPSKLSNEALEQLLGAMDDAGIQAKGE